MTQLLQTNSMVQLEVEFMVRDFSKEGVPASSKVECVESIEVLPGKGIKYFHMLANEGWPGDMVNIPVESFVEFPMAQNRAIQHCVCPYVFNENSSPSPFST